jgi:hypothetical protein
MPAAGGNFGFQIGGQATDLVLVAVNQKGFQALLKNKVKLGGDASAAAGPVGRNAGARTDWKGGWKARGSRTMSMSSENRAIRFQPLSRPVPPLMDIPNIDAFVGNWCALLTTISFPETVAGQQLPQNQWVFHPLIDGCQPSGSGTPSIN